MQAERRYANTLPNGLSACRLNGEYAKALAQLDEHLEHWPKFLVHKNKQRLTKMTQYLIRVRRLAMRSRPKLVPIATRSAWAAVCCASCHASCSMCRLVGN